MKEYKIIAAKLEFDQQPNTVTGNLKSFFFDNDEQIKTEKIEATMNQMSADG